MMFVAWKKLGLLFFYFLCEHTSVEISILQQDWKFNVIVLVVVGLYRPDSSGFFFL